MKISFIRFRRYYTSYLLESSWFDISVVKIVPPSLSGNKYSVFYMEERDRKFKEKK